MPEKVNHPWRLSKPFLSFAELRYVNFCTDHRSFRDLTAKTTITPPQRKTNSAPPPCHRERYSGHLNYLYGSQRECPTAKAVPIRKNSLIVEKQAAEGASQPVILF